MASPQAQGGGPLPRHRLCQSVSPGQNQEGRSRPPGQPHHLSAVGKQSPYTGRRPDISVATARNRAPEFVARPTSNGNPSALDAQRAALPLAARGPRGPRDAFTRLLFAPDAQRFIFFNRAFVFCFFYPNKEQTAHKSDRCRSLTGSRLQRSVSEARAAAVPIPENVRGKAFTSAPGPRPFYDSPTPLYKLLFNMEFI